MPTNGTGNFSDEPSGGGYAGGSGGDLAGAIVQAGAALWDSHQNRKADKANTDKTIAAQKAESELAYQRSVAQTNAANMYNSPEAQMQRYLKAGLNPHLIYGQGTPGNQSSIPQYQPADIRYKYSALHPGAAISQLLPTLMAVGTWMQNMRLSEAELRSKTLGAEKTISETERVNQLIDFLRERNPQLLKQLDNTLSLYPYQKQMSSYMSNQARTKLFEMEQDFRYKYGENLFNEMNPSFGPYGADGKFAEVGGLKRLQFLQEASKTKLLEAKSSFTDFNITDPQALIQMVLGGVMGMAGQQLRLSTHRRPKVTTEREQYAPGGRRTINRKIYER